MGKVMLTRDQRIDLQMDALIAKYQILRGTTAETLAKKLGISVATWRRKRKRCSELTLLQLLRLEAALNIPRAELSEAVGGILQ